MRGDPGATVRAHTIVVGADQSHSGQRALAWASGLAASLGGRVVVVHAVAPMGWMQVEPARIGRKLWRENLERRIADDWCEPLRRMGIPFCVRVMEQGIGTALIDVAWAEDADVVVVGANRPAGPESPQLANLAAYLCRRAPCAVTCVPAEAVACADFRSPPSRPAA